MYSLIPFVFVPCPFLYWSLAPLCILPVYCWGALLASFSFLVNISDMIIHQKKIQSFDMNLGFKVFILVDC